MWRFIFLLSVTRDLLEFRRAQACSTSEEPAEVEGVGKTGFTGRFLDAVFRMCQHSLGVFEALIQEVAMDGLADMSAENKVQVGRGVMHHLSQGTESYV